MRYCEYCGQPIHRYRWSGKINKKYCCREHQMAAMNGKKYTPPTKETVDPRVEYAEAWAMVRSLINGQKNRIGKAGVMGPIQKAIDRQIARVDEAEIRGKYERYA